MTLTSAINIIEYQSGYLSASATPRHQLTHVFGSDGWSRRSFTAHRTAGPTEVDGRLHLERLILAEHAQRAWIHGHHSATEPNAITFASCNRTRGVEELRWIKACGESSRPENRYLAIARIEPEAIGVRINQATRKNSSCSGQITPPMRVRRPIRRRESHDRAIIVSHSAPTHF